MHVVTENGCGHSSSCFLSVFQLSCHASESRRPDEARSHHLIVYATPKIFQQLRPPLLAISESHSTESWAVFLDAGHGHSCYIRHFRTLILWQCLVLWIVFKGLRPVPREHSYVCEIFRQCKWLGSPQRPAGACKMKWCLTGAGVVVPVKHWSWTACWLPNRYQQLLRKHGATGVPNKFINIHHGGAKGP